MQTNDAQHQPANDLPVYEPPVVITFTDAELLETLGPAQAARYQIP